MIDEKCLHAGGIYADKRLALWRLADISCNARGAGACRCIMAARQRLSALWRPWVDQIKAVDYRLLEERLTKDDLSADQRAALAQFAKSALVESAATEMVLFLVIGDFPRSACPSARLQHARCGHLGISGEHSLPQPAYPITLAFEGAIFKHKPTRW
jgi:hypothetical protein